MRQDVGNTLREEYESDPKMAGAIGVLAQVGELVAEFTQPVGEDAYRDALKAKDLEMAGVQDRLERTEHLAKAAGYQLFVEREISGHPLADTIRSVMKDAGNCDSLDEVKDKLDSVLGDLEEVSAAQAEAREVKSQAKFHALKREHDDYVRQAEGWQEEGRDYAERANGLEIQVKKLEKNLERAVEIGEALQGKVREAEDLAESQRLEAYKARSVVGYANSPSLLNLVENVDDEGAIDRIVRENGNHRMSSGRLEEARRTLRRGASSDEPAALEESNNGQLPNHSVFQDMSMSQMRELAGIKIGK